jgi:hypothetical protein
VGDQTSARPAGASFRPCPYGASQVQRSLDHTAAAPVNAQGLRRLRLSMFNPISLRDSMEARMAFGTVVRTSTTRHGSGSVTLTAPRQP